jgi:1,4-alpha-glucan branching enzyme
MGALPYDGGVMFRVWAKFAASVSVVGSFNNWVTTANPLAQEGESGYWSVDVPGAKVGDTYRFYIANSATPYRMDPYARSIQQDSNGNMNSLIASSDGVYDSSGYNTPNWNEAVLYELHIPTFTTQPDGKPGTFDSATVKLPDLADLGVNAIEIMPLGQFSGIQSTGYNPGYIFAVEDTFGGPDQFRDFVNKAHAYGIAVILDVVYNHLGETDLWQFDGWSPGNVDCPYDSYSTNGGIYFYTDYRAHTDFGHSRFDMGRSEVCQYIVDNALRWLEDRFVDGLRFDSVVNIRAVQAGGQIKAELPDGKALLRRINSQIQGSQGWKLTIAEDLQNESSITAPLNDPSGYGFGTQWSDSFYWILRNSVTASDDAGRNLPALAGALSSLNGWNAFKSVLYSENHDKDDPNQSGGRMTVLIDGANPESLYAKKRSTLAAAVVLTAPGIPMLFEGQEFLEAQPFPNSGSYPNPLNWNLRNQYSGIRNLYRDLIHLRRNWFNNTRGLQGANINVLPVFDNILVYHRWSQGGPGDDVIVVCNFSNQPYSSYSIGFPRTGLWRIRFNSDSGAYDGYFENWNSFDTEAGSTPLNGMPASGNIGIGAYTCIVLSQD